MRAISKLIPLYILSILIVSFLSLSQARAIQFDNPVLNQNLKWIKVAQDRSDFIIVGEILSVGKPQKSGNFQEVTYKILDVVNGKLPKRDMRQVTVKHYLSYRSRLQNPDLKKDELSPSLFSPGKRLIVMIQIETEKRFIGMLQKDSFEDVNSDFGTILYSEQNVKALRQLILDRALEILESHKSTSKYIFVGEVLSVGKSPGVYSDPHFDFVYQQVTYRVLDVLKGQFPKKYMNKIVINYPIFGGPLEEPGKPRLSSLFLPENRLIVMIGIDKEGFIGLSFGTFLATDQSVKAMQQLLKGNLSNEQRIRAVRRLTLSWGN